VPAASVPGLKPAGGQLPVECTALPNSGAKPWAEIASIYIQRAEVQMSRPSISDFLTNLDQPMPLPEKLGKLTRNLWRRVVLRQACCGHDGEPGC
jgi:hypothetical protein